MKRVAITALLFGALSSCGSDNQNENKVVESIDSYKPVHVSKMQIETLSDEVDHGLHKITLTSDKDTINVLIYRGVESVTMIQIDK